MKRENRIEHQIRDSIVEQQLVKRGDTVVVGISGGADSVCLLSILSKIKDDIGISLHAAHIDHGIRGKESQADVSYVAALCELLKIPATIQYENVPAYRRRYRLSLEEAARNVRYSFLTDVVHRVNASCAAVGHTQDDQIETILLHIIRGSGIAGLRGLQPRSSLFISGMRKPLTIIRPLLSISRQETEAYCRRHRLDYRFDASNEDTGFVRNRIRIELLPQLRSYNKNVDDSLLRLSLLAADDIDFIEHQADIFWRTAAQIKDRAVYYDTETIRDAPVTIQRQLFRMGLVKLLGNARDFDAGHIDSMTQMITKPAGKIISLPHRLALSSSYGNLILAREGDVPCPLPALKEMISIRIPGNTKLNGWYITARIMQATAKKKPIIYQHYTDFTAILDLNALGTKLVLRNRLPGDRFQPLGMKKSKKLQDFMVDRRIPRTWRNHIPLLCTEEYIAWVVGWQIDERVKVTGSTDTAVKITFKRIDSDH